MFHKVSHKGLGASSWSVSPCLPATAAIPRVQLHSASLASVSDQRRT